MSATNEPFEKTKEVLGAFIEARHLNEAARIGAVINKLIVSEESRESNSGARLPSGYPRTTRSNAAFRRAGVPKTAAHLL